MEHSEDRYYIPHGSHWPIVGSVGLLFLMLGVSTWLNGADMGFYIMMLGVGVMVIMLLGWFGTVIGENQKGIYNLQVDQSFRQGMMWFIFSEVMFFAAFFGALFYARNMVIPWLGGDSNNFFTNLLLWTGYEATWPTNGPGDVGGAFEISERGFLTVLGASLSISGLLLLRPAPKQRILALNSSQRWTIGLPAGVGLGVLAGITGIGGGGDRGARGMPGLRRQCAVAAPVTAATAGL